MIFSAISFSVYTTDKFNKRSISKMVSKPILDPLFGDLPYLGHPLMFIPRSRCPALGVRGCVRVPHWLEIWPNEVFIKVVQSSTLKLAFVVELGFLISNLVCDPILVSFVCGDLP